MAIITLDQSMASEISRMSIGDRRADVVSTSVFGSQALEAAAPMWLCDFQVAVRTDAQAGVWKALILRLKGRVNQLELWDIRRPRPLGTLRGVLTLKTAAVAGAESIQISGGSGQAGATLLPGDWLQIGSGSTQHLLMVTQAATANGVGDITVSIGHPLRDAFVLGTSVVWDRPKGLFRSTESEKRWNYEPLTVLGFGYQLIEDWRP